MEQPGLGFYWPAGRMEFFFSTENKKPGKEKFDTFYSIKKLIASGKINTHMRSIHAGSLSTKHFMFYQEKRSYRLAKQSLFYMLPASFFKLSNSLEQRIDNKVCQ